MCIATPVRGGKLLFRDLQTQPRGPKFGNDFWQAEMTRMTKVYPAPIDDADVGKIADYLTAKY